MYEAVMIAFGVGMVVGGGLYVMWRETVARRRD